MYSTGGLLQFNDGGGPEYAVLLFAAANLCMPLFVCSCPRPISIHLPAFLCSIPSLYVWIDHV